MKSILASVCLILACSDALADGTNPLLDGDRVQSMTEAEYLDAIRNANVNDRGEDGYTPLHHAAAQGNPKTVSALVNADANIAARANDGLTWIGTSMAARLIGSKANGKSRLQR